MCKCEMPGGISIRPDGIHELDACSYEISETYRNVTVEILKCKKCGNVSIGWYKQPNTVTLYKRDCEDER